MIWPWREYEKLLTADAGLPLSSKISEQNTQSILGLHLQVPKRYSRLLVTLVVALGFIVFFNSARHKNSYPRIRHTPPNDSGLPPLYEAYIEYENNLLQQQDDNFAERKYIFMADHLYGVGWGNILQEIIHDSLVASESGRG